MRVRRMVTGAVLAGLVAACGLPGGGGGTLITHNEAPDTGSNNAESTPEDVLRWPVQIIGELTDTSSTDPEPYDIDYYLINRAVPAGTTLRLTCTSTPGDPYDVQIYSLSENYGGRAVCNEGSVDISHTAALPIDDLYLWVQSHTFQASGGYLTVPGSYTVTLTEV